MRIEWVITDADIGKVCGLVEAQSSHPFVRERRRRNVEPGFTPRLDKAHVWKWSIACMLSSRQRSGPGSLLHEFLMLDPFPLEYGTCQKHEDDLGRYALTVFHRAGGIRYTDRRSEWLAANFRRWFEGPGWAELRSAAVVLSECRRQRPDPEHGAVERKAASVAAGMQGFGPKQARNLWQTLGLTRFEIPLDSRVMKWLHKEVMDSRLSSAGLADPIYYDHVMAAVQALCCKAGALPCVFDAAVFSLGNPDWPPEANLW